MDFPHLVRARVYEPIEPIDRGRYEDPLHELLKSHGLGHVTGGGSRLDTNGGIAYAEIEVEVLNLDDAVRTVTEALERAGAPEGSELLEGPDERILRTFGKQQCLAVYLDGVGLPAEVYDNLDLDAVLAEIGAAAGENSYHSSSAGAEETGCYFFGESADDMFQRRACREGRVPSAAGVIVEAVATGARVGEGSVDEGLARSAEHELARVEGGESTPLCALPLARDPFERLERGQRRSIGGQRRQRGWLESPAVQQADGVSAHEVGDRQVGHRPPRSASRWRRISSSVGIPPSAMRSIGRAPAKSAPRLGRRIHSSARVPQKSSWSAL